MSGPNRKLRRAMEAQARKASKSVPPQTPEALILQRMYDRRTFELENAQRQIAQIKSALVGVLIEIGADSVEVSQNTLDIIQMGAVEDVIARPVDNGAVVELVYAEGTDDGDDPGEEE